MPKYYVRDNDQQEARRYRAVKGEANTASFDFSPWTDDNGAITSATWTVRSGNAAVSGEALASNLATAVITTASSGMSLIEIKGAGATNSKIAVLEVYAVDPDAPLGTYDYWYSR